MAKTKDPLAGSDLYKLRAKLQRAGAEYTVTAALDGRYFLEVRGNVSGKLVVEYDQKGKTVRSFSVAPQGSGRNKTDP